MTFRRLSWKIKLKFFLNINIHVYEFIIILCELSIEWFLQNFFSKNIVLAWQNANSSNSEKLLHFYVCANRNIHLVYRGETIFDLTVGTEFSLWNITEDMNLTWLETWIMKLNILCVIFSIESAQNWVNNKL